jgi:hypothetical protein
MMNEEKEQTLVKITAVDVASQPKATDAVLQAKPAAFIFLTILSGQSVADANGATAGNATATTATTNSTRRLASHEAPCAAKFKDAVSAGFKTTFYNSLSDADKAKLLSMVDGECIVTGTGADTEASTAVVGIFRSDMTAKPADVTTATLVTNLKAAFVDEGVTGMATLAASAVTAKTEAADDTLRDAIIGLTDSTQTTFVSAHVNTTGCPTMTSPSIMGGNTGACAAIGTAQLNVETCVKGGVSKVKYGADAAACGGATSVYVSEGMCSQVSATAFIRLECGGNSLKDLVKNSATVKASLKTAAANVKAGTASGTSSTSGAFANGVSALALMAMFTAYLM